MPREILELQMPATMNTASPAHLLENTKASYINDSLLNKPGRIKRRGPLTQASGTPTYASKRPFGMLQNVDKSGNARIGLLTKDTGNELFFDIVNDAFTANSVSLLLANDVTQSCLIADTKPLLGGGTAVGITTNYRLDSAVRNLFFLWQGAAKANYTTGTMTCTRNSTAVTGASTVWSTNVEPGMFLLDNNGFLVGVVKTVTDNTNIVLENNALFTRSAVSYTLTSIRGLSIRVVKGRVTGASTSTTVTGSNTKFKDQRLDSGTWHIFRARDYTYIGQVSSVTSNTSLTLSANAAISFTNERFVAIKEESVAPITPKVGVLNATYANAQWYANLNSVDKRENTAKLWFSDYFDPEGLDISDADGDFFVITSVSAETTPITALGATANALAVFKENELFAVRGSSPDTFVSDKVDSVGTPSGMSVQPYQGGLLFTSKKGIHFFDGIEVANICPDLGDYLERALETFKVDTDRMFSMLYNDHYWVFIETLSPPYNIGKTKGATTTIPTRITICLNLATKGFSFMQNLDIRGSVQMDASTGLPTWFVVNSSTPTTTICDASELFDSTGADTITCEGSTIGPDFYLETKKYNFDDPTMLKHFTELALVVKNTGDTLKLDTVKGLNPTGVVDTETYPISSTVLPTRVKFDVRDQWIQFRIYQNSTSVTDVELGAMMVRLKLMRRGRLR